MNLTDLPTNEHWDAHDWEYVLHGSEFYEGAFTAPDGARAADITADRIVRVDRWWATGGHEYADQDFVAVVELSDGTWAACMAWTDSSGWGCQQGVYWRVTQSLDDAVTYGLDQEGRRKLGLSLVGE